jgi:hypothetical protein
MSSIEWVRFMQDPSDFQIYFKDSIEEIVTDYTADSPYECGASLGTLHHEQLLRPMLTSVDMPSFQPRS